MNTIKILSNNRNNSSNRVRNFIQITNLVSKMCLHHNDAHFMPLVNRTRTKCTTYTERTHVMRSTPTTRQEPSVLMRLKTQSPSLTHSLTLSLSLSLSLTHTHKGFTRLKISVQVRSRKFPEAWWRHKTPGQEISNANRNNRNNHSSVPISLAAAQNACKLFTSTEIESLG